MSRMTTVSSVAKGQRPSEPSDDKGISQPIRLRYQSMVSVHDVS
jgi:hypothetical protein